MLYSKKEREAVEKVIAVFQEYIKSSQYLDLVWSEKLGYILHSISEKTRSLEMFPFVVLDAKSLCDKLFNEIVTDVLQLTGNDHSPWNADPLERAEIERRLAEYTAQLPEYECLVPKQFEDTQEQE